MVVLKGMIDPLGNKSIPYSDDTPRQSDDERFAQLSDSIRKKYEDVLNEPLPQSLQTLIAALHEAEKKKDASD